MSEAIRAATVERKVTEKYEKALSVVAQQSLSQLMRKYVCFSEKGSASALYEDKGL